MSGRAIEQQYTSQYSTYLDVHTWQAYRKEKRAHLFSS